MTSESKKKVIVIGAGPGGYVAAIRAAQLGAEVTVVEKNALGGVCLNVGCIPTKVLLHTAEAYTLAREGARIGLKAENVSVDWKALMDRKSQVIRTLVGGVGTLLRSNGVKVAEGEGTFVSPREVAVTRKDGTREVLSADAVIVATGFKAFDPSRFETYAYADHPNVVTAMEFERLLSAGGPTTGHLICPSEMVLKEEAETQEKDLAKLARQVKQLEEKLGGFLLQRRQNFDAGKTGQQRINVIIGGAAEVGAE